MVVVDFVERELSIYADLFFFLLHSFFIHFSFLFLLLLLFSERLQFFREEQEWFQHGARYDDAPTSTPEGMRMNHSLKPIVPKFNRPWIKNAQSSFGWRLPWISLPFWKAKKFTDAQKKLEKEEADAKYIHDLKMKEKKKDEKK